jgi:uncharacterized membrane protein YphA (DoxX/SURF4 family)
MFEGFSKTSSRITGIFLSIWPYRGVRILLGGLFAWAGILKLSDPEAFAVTIAAFGILPEPLVMPVAVVLPALEALLSIALVLDIEGALSAITGLLLVFIAIVAYGIFLGLDVDCGCFGPEDPESRAFPGLRGTLVRDLLMLGGVVYLYAWRILRSRGPVRLKSIVKHIRTVKEKSPCPD